MILKTNKARISVTNKDLEKKFHTKEYEGIEFVFKNMTLKQEIEFESINAELNNEEASTVKGLLKMVNIILTDNLVEVKGLKNEDNEELTLSTELINDLIDYNFELSFGFVAAYLSLRGKDKKKS